MNMREIKCEQALRQLFDYIDRELAENDREVLEHHLHTCQSCFSRFEFEKRVKEKLGQLGEEKVDSNVNARIRNLIRGFR
jgi:anti-sigma factor (TIGR02949 family)